LRRSSSSPRACSATAVKSVAFQPVARFSSSPRQFNSSGNNLNSFIKSNSFQFGGLFSALPGTSLALTSQTFLVSPIGGIAAAQRDYAIRRRRNRRRIKKPFDPSKSKEVTWREYTDRLQTLPYQAIGGERYGIPKCRGCDKRLHKDEMRIQCIGIFLPQPWQRTYQAIKGLSTRPQKPGFPTKYTFCANVACIEKAIADKDNKPDYRISYPIFDGRVGMTGDLKDRAGSAPPGVSWIDMPGSQSDLSVGSSSSMSSGTSVQQEARL